ncbi:MAG: kelch repeat-containing protein [Planctomycetota bacterium]
MNDLSIDRGMAAALSSILFLASPLAAQDECDSAVPIAPGLTAGTNVGATTSPTTGACGDIGSDVWYSFVAPCTGRATIGFCAPGAGADFDATLAVFSGDCTMLQEIVCADDVCGMLPEVGFTAFQGQTYLIEVGGYEGAQGTFTLAVDCAALPADDCAGAVPMQLGLTTGSNVGATTSTPTGSCRQMGDDVWYVYQADCTGSATVSLCDVGASATYDATIAVFSGACGDLTELQCDDDSCGTNARVTFAVDAGASYFIAVGGFMGEQGDFTVSLSCTPGTGPWRNKARRLDPLLGAAGFYFEDKIYATHGWTTVFELENRIYDIATNTWSTGPAPMAERMELAGVECGGFFYAIGGRSHVGNLATMEIYDPVAGIWSMGPDMPTPRSSCAAVEIGGMVHVVGGRDETEPRTGNPLGEHEVYDTKSGLWSTMAPLPIPVADCYAVVAIGGQMIVFGGWDGTSVTSHTQIYDAALDQWSMGTPMPTARDQAAAGVMGFGPMAGRAVVIGGLDDTLASLDAVEVYDPVEDTWSSGPNLPLLNVGLTIPGVSTRQGIHVLGLEPGLEQVGHASLLAVEAQEVERLGTPPNALALRPGLTPPIAGKVWDPIVDHTTFAPTATLDLLLVGPATGFSLPAPFGTLLCDPSLPFLPVIRAPGRRFSVPLPVVPEVIGVRLCGQAASLDTGGLQLTNALDIVVGVS